MSPAAQRGFDALPAGGAGDHRQPHPGVAHLHPGLPSRGDPCREPHAKGEVGRGGGDVLVAVDRGHRDHRYRGASGLDLPLARYLGGARLVFKDGDLSWQDRGKPRRPEHSALRDYLDGVFAWANTGSLANQAKKIARADLRPGDFFVLPGGPGHAVLILDVATGPEGQLALLLGQGFMPAQSFHVLRPAGAPDPWFRVAPADTAVATPFWDPFPWSSLRRLE